MSINPIGYALDNRVAASSRPTPPDSAQWKTPQPPADPSLPITSQVPELDALQDAVDTFNRFIPMATNNLLFSIDEDNGTVVVKLVDSSTQDVIRQIPSVEALEISRSLGKLKGLLLQSQA